MGITRARRRATILNAANRRVYGQWTSAIPSRFLAELPPEHVEVESTLSGGASLWRAATDNSDPFAHLERGKGRGPGWERASQRSGGEWSAATSGGLNRATAARHTTINARPLSSTVGGDARTDLRIGDRVFHNKFGMGTVKGQDGNKLQIDFDQAGSKMVLDSFVSPA